MVRHERCDFVVLESATIFPREPYGGGSAGQLTLPFELQHQNFERCHQARHGRFRCV